MTIEHRKGQLHGNADALSRIPCRQCGQMDDIENKDTQVTQTIFNISLFVESDDLKTLKETDHDLRTVMSWVISGQKPSFKDIASESYYVKSLWNQYELLMVIDGILVRKWDNTALKQTLCQVVVPSKERRKILTHAHDIKSSGH